MDSKIEPVAAEASAIELLAAVNAGREVVERGSDGAVFIRRDVCVEALLAAEQRGREWAAQKLDRRITQIANDYGDYEPDTNATNLPDDWELVCQELENLAVAIRKGPHD